MPLSGEYAPGKSAWARDHAERYEASDGADSATLRGRPIIVLTSVGAVSGKLRKTALMRVEHEGRYAVVGSKGGAATHPKWVFNLRVNPHVELQDGPSKRDFRAHEAEGPERAAWWERAVKVWPDYAGYQNRTDRKIPVFVLEPIVDGVHGVGAGGVSTAPTPDVSFYDTGAVRYRGFQLGGQMHGAWEFLRKDGSLMRAGSFDRGRQVGVWRTFDRAGKVVKETDFSIESR